MFSHRSFLVLGGGAGDIISLMSGGYEILSCRFQFQQGVDRSGKATTKVYGGSINVTLSQLPKEELIEWGLNSRKFKDGAIISLDAQNIPVEKILFSNAACIGFNIEYVQQGSSYSTTNLVIQAEKLIVGDGIDFDNEWSEN